MDRPIVENVNPYVSTGMVCGVNQEWSPKAISIDRDTGCSQSLITSDWLAGIGNSGRKEEVFYLTTHSTHFIYGYMASDIW